MKDIVFTMTGDTEKSTVASGRIATYISHVLELPLLRGKEIAVCRKPGVMLFVNGPPLYALGYLLELYTAVVNAKVVVWVNNDYTTPVPRSTNVDVKSLFWRAFAVRRQKRRPIITWSTCADEVAAYPGSTYINWNALAFMKTYRKPAPVWDNSLFYYGAFRQNREAYFERFFQPDPKNKYRVRISSTSRKFEKYVADYGVNLEAPMTPLHSLLNTLHHSGLGLYIEDAKSHTNFHSPANRFYEMLSARMPIVFQEECVENFKKRTKYTDIDNYVVSGPADIRGALKDREAIADVQGRWVVAAEREAHAILQLLPAKLRAAQAAQLG